MSAWDEQTCVLNQKMVKMRKAKEKEIFQEFQAQQEKMTNQLHSHMQQVGELIHMLLATDLLFLCPTERV